MIPQFQTTQNPQRPPHPIQQAGQMLGSMPVATPHSMAINHLMQHAIPIYHQLTALKQALAPAKQVGAKNNPGGLPNAF